MGLYEDPMDLLGFYSWNLLRAARLVVDTGMHAFEWSRQKAIDYLKENTGASEVCFVNKHKDVTKKYLWTVCFFQGQH